MRKIRNEYKKIKVKRQEVGIAFMSTIFLTQNSSILNFRHHWLMKLPVLFWRLTYLFKSLFGNGVAFNGFMNKKVSLNVADFAK